MTTTTALLGQGDSGLTTAANLIGIVIGAVVLVGLIWAAVAWWKWRDPVEAAFLIPKETYMRRRFDGAPRVETRVKELTVGIGTYDVTVQVRVKHAMDIVQIRFLLDETGVGARPVDVGLRPSRFFQDAGADHLGRHRYMDWNGEVKVSNDFDLFPRHVPEGDTCHVTHRIETVGEWDGEIAIPMALRGRFGRTVTARLPLRVSRDRDDIPFLRVAMA